MSRLLDVRSAALLALAVYLFAFVSSVGFLLKLLLWTPLWYLTGGNEWLRLFRLTWRRDAT